MAINGGPPFWGLPETTSGTIHNRIKTVDCSRVLILFTVYLFDPLYEPAIEVAVLELEVGARHSRRGSDSGSGE